ncbi:hypothetical protein BL253_26815 [Pseudofrankia asymbiotica]|uniref:Uncharacterized protein n=1 Tax=Pseudofrankia asymbiotica TaxID=1834516 RepID=A0A1V2I6R0_9ACTN|nr:hypothetical protein BL253_26815 [Pseudofrankia asymbiotica]
MGAARTRWMPRSSRWGWVSLVRLGWASGDMMTRLVAGAFQRGQRKAPSFQPGSQAVVTRAADRAS